MSVADIDARQQKVDAEVARLQARWPEEFRLGFRAGYFRQPDYPLDLHAWPLDRRNGWWAGWNQGRVKLDKESKTRRSNG
jgi:hypothetical protein